MRILDTTNAFTTCKKRIKNVFSPGPVIHHSKVERHRCNIVKPPPCIHTADIRPLQSTTLQAPHCRHHTAGHQAAEHHTLQAPRCTGTAVLQASL